MSGSHSIPTRISLRAAQESCVVSVSRGITNLKPVSRGISVFFCCSMVSYQKFLIRKTTSAFHSDNGVQKLGIQKIHAKVRRGNIELSESPKNSGNGLLGHEWRPKTWSGMN